MYKYGNFGIYNGMEYQTTCDMNRNYFIFTSDKTKVDDSFCDEDGDGVFIKKIKKEELEEYYEITTYAIWNDMKFLLMGEKEDCYILFTEDSKIAKEYGFEVHDRDCFTKDVKKDSVKLIEEREDLK